MALSPGFPLFPLLLFLWLTSQLLSMASDAVNIQGTPGSVFSLGSLSCQALAPVFLPACPRILGPGSGAILPKT